MRISVLLCLLTIAIAAFTAHAQSSMSRPERVAQLLGTARVLSDRCQITGNPAVLAEGIKRAGYELTDFVPGARFWSYTRKAIDQRFELIAKQGIGSACSAMNEIVQATLPGY